MHPQVFVKLYSPVPFFQRNPEVAYPNPFLLSLQPLFCFVFFDKTILRLQNPESKKTAITLISHLRKGVQQKCYIIVHHTVYVQIKK